LPINLRAQTDLKIARILEKSSGSLWGLLTLRPREDGPFTPEINIPCQIRWADTNGSGDLVLTIDVKAELHKTIASFSKGVNFNNMRAAQLDLSEVSESRFEIKGGFLRLEVNSWFNCEFNFPPQTNSVGRPWGIFGERVRSPYEGMESP
jgi:hypothetical protein